MKTDLELIREGKIRAVTFDIESTGLKADWGYTICACVKEVLPDSLNGKTHTLVAKRSDFTDESLVVNLAKLLNEFDLVIGWYSSRFDFPFINGRVAKWGLNCYPERNFRRDLCLIAKGNFALAGHSLANVSRLMFGKTEKTRTDYDTWIKAIRKDKSAIDYIVDHCQKDVLETEKVYKRMMPLFGKLRKGG